MQCIIAAFFAVLLWTTPVAAQDQAAKGAPAPAATASPALELKTAPAEPCGGALVFLQRLEKHEPIEKRIFESGYRWRAYLAARALAALDRMAEVSPEWKKTSAALCDGMLEQVRKDATPMARRDVTDALFVLGVAAYLQRDYLPAAQAFSDALALDRKNRDYLAALGHMHTLAQDHMAAAPLLASAWKEEERLNGRSATAAWLAENVSDAHRSVGDFVFAAKVAEESADLYARTLGPESLQVGIARARMGEALLDAEKVDEAEAALRSALDIFMKTAGPDTPVVAEVLRALGTARAVRDDRVAAEELYGAALVSAANWYGLEAPDLSPFIAPIGILRYRAGKYDEAIELLRDARNGAIAIHGYGTQEVEELEGWIRLCEDAKIRGALPGEPKSPDSASDPVVIRKPAPGEASPGFRLDSVPGDANGDRPGAGSGATDQARPVGPVKQ